MFFDGSAEMADIMESFFQMGDMMGGHRQGRRKQRQVGEDVEVTLHMTLEELYTGKDTVVEYNRNTLCARCDGLGASRNAKRRKCQGCGGRGVRISIAQVGILARQFQERCETCQGAGSAVYPEDVCQACRGVGVVDTRAQQVVQVPPGMQDEAQLRFPGAGTRSSSGEEPGDVVVTISQEAHPVFIRKGSDLHLTRTLSIAEALCGFQFAFTHLDGRHLFVRVPPGTVTAPGERMIVGEGMPSDSESGFGDLIITFTVQFPERLNASQLNALKLALPLPAAAHGEYDPEEAHDCYLAPQSMDSLREELQRAASAARSTQDDFQETGVQCQQQ